MTVVIEISSPAMTVYVDSHYTVDYHSCTGVRIMSPQFIGRDITVTVNGEMKTPVSFKLGKQEYTIAEIVASWPDYGFGRINPGRKRWWQRHHRNYYHVRTTEGDVYEIYHDRGVNMENTKYKKWFLTRKL